MILGRGADQRDTADVDVLDHFVEGDVGLGDGRFKRIEIHRDQIDVIPAEVLEFVSVGFSRAGQQATVHGGMQRLHAPPRISGEPV